MNTTANNYFISISDSKPSETRAWDFGKVGVFGPKPSTFDDLDEKWLRDRRSDRISEFAPPSSLYSQGGLRKPYASSSSSSTSSFSSTSRYSNFVKSKDNLPSTSQTYTNVPPPPVVIEPPPKPFQPPQTFWKQRKDPPQKPIPITDELPAPVPESSEEFKRGKGTEIAPPPTFEYYHGDNQKRKPARPGSSNPEEMMDAISAGLKALREQYEKKQKEVPH